MNEVPFQKDIYTLSYFLTEISVKNVSPQIGTLTKNQIISFKSNFFKITARNQKCWLSVRNTLDVDDFDAKSWKWKFFLGHFFKRLSRTYKDTYWVSLRYRNQKQKKNEKKFCDMAVFCVGQQKEPQMEKKKRANKRRKNNKENNIG